ncbi:MAG: hypothetical protein ABIT37_02480 [Luteolibacter sp.]
MLIDFVHHNPGEQPRESRYQDPITLGGLGFTGQVCNLHVQAGVTLQSFAPDLWEKDDAGLRWIESYAADIGPKLQRVKRAGIECLAWTDFVVLPKVLVERFRNQISSTTVIPDEVGIKGVFTPDIHHPLTQEIVRAQIREIFSSFPELDGLVVRVGETYLHDLPHHTGGDPIVHGVESHVVLLELLREEVCRKLNRTLVYRTWLSGIDEDAGKYLEASGRIEPHPKLLFSIKHCTGDYHRTHPFSPPIGVGAHRHLVEVQCQREYEGKGAFPHFIAAGVIDGFEEDSRETAPAGPRCLRDLIDREAFSGLLTWSRGGGWVGPYIQDELWCEINTRVLALWAQNRGTVTDELTGRVLADLGFPSDHHPAMKRLLDLSARAVLLGITGTRGDIDTLWTRDEFLGGFEPGSPQMMRAVNSILKSGRIEDTLAELGEAVELWTQIETLASSIRHPDAARLAFLRTSCSYGRIFQQVVRAGWTIILLGEQGSRSSNFEKDRIIPAIENYHHAWSEWRELSLRSECSTLYRDTYCRYITDQGMKPVPGMGASVSRYAKLVASSP